MNLNKVNAYDSGGHRCGTPGKVYVSTDGGHTFTLSEGSVTAGLAPHCVLNTSLAVNPHPGSDLWRAEGNAVYGSVDSGATWTKLSHFASILGSNPWPDVQGRDPRGVGQGSVWRRVLGRGLRGRGERRVGAYRSDDAGATWIRFNDDTHQFGGIGVMAADQNSAGASTSAVPAAACCTATECIRCTHECGRRPAARRLISRT